MCGMRGHGDGPGVIVFLATLLLLSGCALILCVLMTDLRHVSLSGGGWLRGEYCNLARVINPRVNKWRDQWGRSVRPAQSGEADAVMTCNLCYSDQPGFFSVTSNSVPPTRAHTPASDPSRRCISDTLAGVRVYIWKAISSLQLDGTFAH